jgi:hypothetical protein
MARWLSGGVLVFALLMSVGRGVVDAQDHLNVTVQQLFDRGHRLEVSAGGEVVWADPHFERVWFPTGAGKPRVERVDGGFRATFVKPGTYHGAFTVVAGHATNDVYKMIIVVKPRPE